MKKLMIAIIGLTVGMFFTACNNHTANNDTVQLKTGTVVSNVMLANIGDYVLDDQGRKYKKITNSGETNVSGISKTEVWERVDPFDKTRWYTPTLGSYVWTNQPISFNSLFRMEGEDYPAF